MGGGQLAETNTCGPMSAFFFAGALTFGTLTTLTCQFLYQMESVGANGYLKPYNKPITTVFVMFVAMMAALPIYWVQQVFFTEPNLRQRVPNRVLLKMAWPSLFDMLGTGLGQAGLVYTSASMYQILRCAVILCTATLKIFVFGERLTSYMWVGILMNTAAMALVSSTLFIGSDDEAVFGTNPELGFLYIMGSVVVCGMQYVFEEKVMTNDKCPPLVVIGMEGVWGTLMTVFFLFPVAYYIPGTDDGSLENPYDTWVMWQNSPAIQWMLVAFFMSVTLYNALSMYLTKYLSAIWHAILDNFRPASVWGTDLAIHYLISAAYGEALSPYSGLQLVGLVLLFVGTFIYNGSFPCLTGDGYQDVDGALKSPGIRTPLSMASPNLMRSPLLNAALDDERRREVIARERARLAGKGPAGYGGAAAAAGQGQGRGKGPRQPAYSIDV
uniref:EamA domain-containing protein n=1 Tax=Heterosigma akashiwo TaxID=2829 RepID=A0A7S3UY76_HETAK|mmetsp:Transcript_24760/g.42525  ORF Transcript_24760/g.42525 Transcript_24760/m.42525 type:complete len:441 (-) Transcript_24760:25-1347(-)